MFFLEKIKTFVKTILSKLKKEQVLNEDINSFDIKTSKNNFDFRGIFSLRPISINKEDYRKEEFLVRILGLALGGQLVIIFILVLVINTLLPLQKVTPMFLSVTSKDDQVYWVEPLEKKTKAFRLVTESLVYQYIEARESIDLQTENQRYQFVSWLSSNKVFQEFEEEYSEVENKNSPLTRAQRFKLARGVKISFIDFLSDNQLQVDFDMYEYQRGTGKIVSKREMRATLTIEYRQEEITAKEKFMNPLGLRIKDYSLATKKLEEFIILQDEGKK